MWVLQQAFGMGMNSVPWEPNQREGEFLLSEIMQSGNFGHHDDRIKKTNLKGVWGEKATQLQHVLLVARHYPSEIFWTPVWFVFHKLWKKFGKH